MNKLQSIRQCFEVDDYVQTNFGVSGRVIAVVQGADNGWAYNGPYYLLELSGSGRRKFKDHWVTQAEIHTNSWITRVQEKYGGSN